MNEVQKRSVLRLFKGYVVDNDTTPMYDNLISVDKGIIYSDKVPSDIVELSVQMYGIDSLKWNQTFHKSFQTVIDTPIEELVTQQLIHYFTTYGLEILNLYKQDYVYIPHELLEIPEIQEDVKLTLISRITKEELKQKLMNLLTSGIALSTLTISDIQMLSEYIDLNQIELIKNNEVKTFLYDKYNLVPEDPTQFLRYLIYKLTNKTLLIKDQDTIRNLKNASPQLALTYLNLYIDKYGIEKLQSIYLRYKKLFLALKRHDGTQYEKQINKLINRINKKANKYHKPVYTSMLNTLTNDIDTVDKLESRQKDIINSLNNITVFREIRILNSIIYRLNNYEEIVYKIRNKKSYVTKIEQMSEAKYEAQSKLYKLIKEHLLERLNKKLEGKTIYIPDNVIYTAPTSEKQFVGNIPEGSCITLPRNKNLVVGVHWVNLSNDRVDLDLHSINETESYGWDTSYKSNDVIFSGDVTDAPLPNGATELFLIKETVKNNSFMLTLNNYTQNDEDVPYEIVIAECDDNEISKNYVINPNNILTTINCVYETDRNTQTLGLVDIEKDTIKFYFDNSSIDKSITTRTNNITKTAYKYLNNYRNTQITLNELLSQCNTTIVDKPTTTEYIEVEDKETSEKLYKKVEKQCDINLDINTLDKTTIIDLFRDI